MRRIIGCLALLMALPYAAAAQDTVPREEYQATVRDLHNTKSRAFALEAALSRSHLQQMAMLVNLATQGKSRLLLGAGILANPQIGKIPMMEGRGNAPFITLYPVSELRSVQLADVGEVDIQGAVSLSVGARTPDKKHCEAGSYLLALKATANGAPSLLLLDAQVNSDGQVHYQEALRIPAERVNGATDRGNVMFLGANEVSQEHPAWQVRIDLPSKEQHVRAYLNLDITML